MQLHKLVIVPNVSLANTYHNADILGCNRIAYAESLGFKHEYDVALSDAHTQDARYLLLKKLVDENLIDTKVFENTVRAIAKHCESLREVISLRFAIGFCKKMTRIANIRVQDFSLPEQSKFTS